MSSMKQHKPLLFYTPRVLSVTLLAILSYFAVQAFRGVDDTVMESSPFVIYLFPVFILLVVTAISWKRARLRGTLFIIGGFFYGFGVNELSTSSLAMVATPLILLGVLFHISQFYYEK